MSAPLRLLIVEDNDDAQLLLARLRHAGYQPDYARVDNAQQMQRALQDGDW